MSPATYLIAENNRDPQSIPFERALLPFVKIPDAEHRQEHHHRPETEDADLAECDSPGKQKSYFEVEDD